MRLPAVALMTCFALALGGCTKTIDSGKLEKFIAGKIETRLHVNVKSVKCPSNKTAKKGDSFTCTVTGADGTKGPAIITELDTKGNIHLNAPLLHTRDVEAILNDRLTNRLKRAVHAKCPAIVIGRKGGAFKCSVADAQGASSPIAVVQGDAKGHFRCSATAAFGATSRGALSDALSGCRPVLINRTVAQSFIARTVVAQVGAKLDKVECPATGASRKGATFTCTVTGADGTTGPVLVKELDYDGNVHVDAPFVHTGRLQSTLTSGISKQVGKREQVSCPQIIIAKAGGVLQCRAVDSTGSSVKVQVTQTDNQGHVTYKTVR